MKRIISTILLTLPLTALCLLPKSASAEPGNRTSNDDRQSVTISRDNRGDRYDRQPVAIERDHRGDRYDRNREPHFVQRFRNRHHQRRWIAGHYVKVNHRHQWVPGHYVYR
jgi:hypothetical protein